MGGQTNLVEETIDPVGFVSLGIGSNASVSVRLGSLV